MQPDPQLLLSLVRMPMPFGKYQGRVIIDLPEEYLFWFSKNEFPEGKLGDLMQLCLALKIEGLDSLIKPLARQRDSMASNQNNENHKNQRGTKGEGDHET